MQADSSEVMAVVPTIPGREEALEKCLLSLRPQVGFLAVICNGFERGPSAAFRIADEIMVMDKDVAGSAAKLWYCSKWESLYLGCDDDLEYPPNYVETMRAWVYNWQTPVLVTTHGRVLNINARSFVDAEVVHRTLDFSPGGWVNYPGGCGLAFDAGFLKVPHKLPGKNNEEAELAVWAQRAGVPIWCVPHEAGWIKYLLPKEAETIFKIEKATEFKGRNDVLRTVDCWKVFMPGID